MVLKKLSCPTCNAGCGLLVEVNNNKILSVKPDPNYPLSGGFCCPKGIALGDITNDKDRILKPLKRSGNKFHEISWKKAMHEIAAKLTNIRNKYSPHSIAYYMGTNSLHQYAHSMFAVGFMRAIGSLNMYNAGSVDNNNKFVAQNFLYGSSMVMPIPDIPKTDLLILIGTNPAVTNLSLVTCSNVLKVMKGIKGRGGEIYIIDPRRNETAKILTKKNDGYHIPIFPDTDIYFLLSMINVILVENLEDKNFLNRNSSNYENLRELVDFFTPKLAEKICKIPSEKIYEISRKFAKTKKAVIYGRLGTCLSTFSTLNAWAIDVLNIIAGKLDRPGGAIFGKNVINIANLGKIVGMGAFDTFRSRIGNYPDVMGAIPLSILAREILHEKDPVRALIISGGNPFLSAPNSNEFRRALEKLELCVVLDFYINETADFAANYILPTRTPMENSNTPVYQLNYQIFPHVEYCHALITPDKHGPKPEWEILLSLSRLMKVPMVGNRILNLIPKIYKLFRKEFHPDFFIKLFLFLGQVIKKRIPPLSSGTLSVKKLRKNETILLGDNEYGVLKRYLQTKNKKITLLNPLIEEQIKLCKNSYNKKIEDIKRIEAQINEFVVIGRRNLKTMNSWMHNIEKLWRNKQEPQLLMNSQDASRLNLIEHDLVILQNEFGSIKIPVSPTDEIMPGVICYPHGWGHKNPYLSYANQHPGENINFLTNSSDLDKLSGMPVLNGYKVFLKKFQ